MTEPTVDDLRAEGIRALVARFDDDWLEDGLAGEVGRRVLFTGTSCTSLGPPEDEAERFNALLDLLRVEASRPADRESAELRRHLLSASLLWAQRWREAQLEEGGATRSDVQLHQQFLEALERDFRASHDAGHYASELGVTPGNLSRILTRLTGRPTKQLILERVVLEAVRLLRFSDLSVKEIAARLGFSDQFAFSKAFKRQRGEAPLDFRGRQSTDRGASPRTGGGYESLISWLARNTPFGSQWVRSARSSRHASASKKTRASTLSSSKLR